MKTEYPETSTKSSIDFLRKHFADEILTVLDCFEGLSQRETIETLVTHIAQIAEDRFSGSEDVREFLAQLCDIS